MKRFISILLFLILAVAIFAAEKEKIQILDFSKGLVTIGGDLSRSFDEASIAHNIDLTLFPGDFSPRRGYSEVFTITGIDSILWNGMVPISYRNGDKQLLVLADWEDSAFGAIFHSGVNSFLAGIRDSIVISPDTATMRAMARDSLTDSVVVSLRVRKSVYTWSVSQKMDTSVTLEGIVDSMMVLLNSVISPLPSFLFTPLSSQVDFGELSDTGIYFAEEGIAVDLGYSPFWSNLWDSLIVSDTTEMLAASTRIPVTGLYKAAQFRDQVYIVNGVSRSVVFTPEHVGEFPLRAPGEIISVPLATSGNLDGAYRYAVSWGEKTDTLSDSIFNVDVGFLSSPAIALSQQMLLYGFPTPPRDTIAGLYAADTLADTTKLSTLYIYRTAGGVGAVRSEDSLFLLDTLIRLNKHSAWDIAEYTDTFSDSLLRTHTFLATVGRNPFDTGATDPILRTVLDSEDPPDSGAGGIHKSVIVTSPGSPSFMRLVKGGSQVRGLFTYADNAVLEWDDCVGYLWTCSFLDTITGVYSDTGRSLVIAQTIKPDSATTKWATNLTHQKFSRATYADSVNTGLIRDSAMSIELVMPDAPAADSHLVCVLYRSPLEIQGMDSASIPSITEQFHPGEGVSPLFPGPDTTHGRFFISSRDTTFRHFATEINKSLLYYVGTFSPGDTIIDSLWFDGLLSQQEYRRNFIPAAMKDVVVSGNRLVLADGNGVYISTPTDSGIYFNILNYHAINPDDGDQNVAMWEQSQGVLKVAKNYRTYQLLPFGGTWVAPELSKNYGCVAPLSYAASPEGDYFLSLDGVRLEDENQYREKSFLPTLVSAPLDNFKNLPVSVMKNAIATYHDNKYILYIPGLDTAYVLNKAIFEDGRVSYGWTTWSIPIVASARFNSSENSASFTGDSLLFTIRGAKTIYALGTRADDLGLWIQWLWQSGITNLPDGFMREVHDFAFYIQGNDTSSTNFVVQFIREDGVITGTGSFTLASRDTTKYHFFEQKATSAALFWRLRLGNPTVGFPYPTPNPETEEWKLQIEAIWMTLTKQEHYGSQ